MPSILYNGCEVVFFEFFSLAAVRPGWFFCLRLPCNYELIMICINLHKLAYDPRIVANFYSLHKKNSSAATTRWRFQDKTLYHEALHVAFSCDWLNNYFRYFGSGIIMFPKLSGSQYLFTNLWKEVDGEFCFICISMHLMNKCAHIILTTSGVI